MNTIELAPNYNWNLLSAIVDAIKDSEMDLNSQDLPLLDIDSSCSPFTGKFTLLINQGGLQNRETPKLGKDRFKDEVLPYLMQSIGTDSRITGKLELHIAQGNVKRAILQYN